MINFYPTPEILEWLENEWDNENRETDSEYLIGNWRS